MTDGDDPSAAAAALDPDQVRGARYLGKVFPLLAKLRPDGCARDRAGNRTLFYDQYAALVLLSMFSPAMDSLRAIRQASALKKVQKLLGGPSSRPYSLGSLSEAARVFDPALLRGVADALGAELRPLAADPRLADVRGALTLCDGTLLAALPRLAASAWNHSHAGRPLHGWRMHCQFDLSLGAPRDVAVTDYRNSGASDERAVLKRTLSAGRCYVADRGYFDYSLFDAVVAAGSDYVCRVKRHVALTPTDRDGDGERPVTDAARAAGVARDVVGTAGIADRHDRRANHPVRLVYVDVTVAPRDVRGGGTAAGPPKVETLILATDLLDVPAEVVALVYKHRWGVELFFRFFKQVLGCRHLISDDPRGVSIQCYCAVIACLLVTLWSGRPADKATWRMVGWFLGGLADEAELLAHLSAPDRRGVKLAAKAALWKKLGC
jgi:hypothetical protein